MVRVTATMKSNKPFWICSIEKIMGDKRHNNKTEVVEILKSILGKVVIYSRSGGGNISILLQKYENNVSIWSYYYWEISQREKLIATSEDDTTAITGSVALGAKAMEGKRLLGFQLWPDLTLCLYFEDDIDYVIFPQEPGENFASWSICEPEDDAVYELDENNKLIKRSYWFPYN